MRATLEYDLPEDEVAHQQAVSAGALAGAICGVMQKTRAWLKYGHDFTTPEEAIEAVRAELREVADLAGGEILR